MLRHLLLAFFLIGFSLPNTAASLDTAKLNQLISAVDQHQKIMGALTVSHKGKNVYNKAWGIRSITSKGTLPTNTETKFRIGSISKTFTAVMILQLVEEGKLSLDNKLSQYYPSLPNASEITLEQMLNHHSGLYNFTDSSYYDYRTKPKSREEMLEMFRQQPPSFLPGTKGEYSNTNYVLLGYILEKVTGENYAANLRKRITSKLSLKHTYNGSAPDAFKNEASSFYYTGENWKKDDETHMSITLGAGSLVSTTNDLVRFIEGLFAGKLVSKETLQKMVIMKDGYGLGIFQFPFDEKYCYGHTGGIDEFHSMLGYFPGDSLAFAFTGNGQNIEMNDLAIGVLSICFNRAYEIPNYNVEAYKIATAELAKYEGIYSSAGFPLKIKIWKEGEKLLAQATGQGAFALTPVSDSVFKFEPARIQMVFDLAEKSEIKKFTLTQGRGNYVFVKE